MRLTRQPDCTFCMQKGPAAFVNEGTARFRELYRVLLVTNEKLELVLLFELHDLPAERGLRNSEPQSCSRETQVFGQNYSRV